MKRFLQRIAEKARDVSQPPIVTVALGDSVTQGVMQHHMLDSRHVYHRQLQDHLEAFFPATSFSTFNAGVSGDNVINALSRVNRDVLARDPDLVLIAFGLNDSLKGVAGLAEFQNGLSSIVDMIRQGSKAEVLLVTPPFMAKRESFRIHAEHLSMAALIIETQNSGVLARYAAAIREVAHQTGAPLADVHAEWQRLASDGLDTDVWLINGLNHPDPRGHKLASLLVFHAILAQRPRES